MRYHPPRQEHIPSADFEFYKQVISTAYQFHDQMLGTLLDKAGEDVTALLISDHGFHPDHMRPKLVPRIPAGPAIEHRDLGIFVANGPGLKRDEHIYGVSVLDVAPTLLALYNLPVGADMDGKVITGAFEQPPASGSVPSWEAISGQDGRHPEHTRLDPEAAQQSLDQLVALGYIAKPDENAEKAVADTIQELRFNLAESYQDAGRHADAAAILRDLRREVPDEVRFAVDLFYSCRALGLIEEMREIVADLDGRRRTLYHQGVERWQELAAIVRERREQRQATAGEHRSVESGPVRLLSNEERAELIYCRKLARFYPAVVDYLRAQVLEKDRLYAQALEALQAVQQAQLTRPGLLLQVGDLYRKMGLREKAEEAFKRALSLDPENPQAYFGLALLALRGGNPAVAAQTALNAIQQQYHFPAAHFVLGNALVRLRQPQRAADSYRVAIRLNPNFAQAHLRLAVVLRELGDAVGFGEHWRMFREMRTAARKPARTPIQPEVASAALPAAKETRQHRPVAPAPSLGESVVVVSGLPRSGTSMLMQMLSAGGIPILSDGERQADEDNPRGYLEYEPVKTLHRDNSWIKQARGKAIKVVAPLLSYLPTDLTYSVLFIQRDMDEVLASQQQMLNRRATTVEDGLPSRTRLREEYERLTNKSLNWIDTSPHMRLLLLDRAAILADPHAAALQINTFLGGSLASSLMAAQVDQTLDRQHYGTAKRRTP